MDRLELPKSEYPIRRQIEIKNLSAFFIVIKKEKSNILQKELAKRLKARYDTKMDGNEWLEVSSDGIPLCRIKYNGQFLSNADQNLSDEYRSKIADIQDEISTVREYVGLYEHAPQMKAADVSDYRQLAAFGDTVLAATYSEKSGFRAVQKAYPAPGHGRSERPAPAACGCVAFSATFAERPIVALIKPFSYSLAKQASRLTSYKTTCSKKSSRIMTRKCRR